MPEAKGEKAKLHRKCKTKKPLQKYIKKDM